MSSQKQMQYFFYRLDNANGEIEITPILAEMNDFIDGIADEKEKSFAEQNFKYYFTKRLAHIEDEVNRLKNSKSEFDMVG